MSVPQPWREKLDVLIDCGGNSRALNKKGTASVWARVVECTAPRPTKGTDNVCNMYIVDHSPPASPAAQAGLTTEVLFFARSAASLPSLRRPGDLVFLQNVRPATYKEKSQLIAKLCPGLGCGYSLYDSDSSGSELPYNSWGANGLPRDMVTAMLRHIRTCNAEQSTAVPSCNDKHVQRIETLQFRSRTDLICKVVAVEDLGSPQQTLHVWDGTDYYPHNPRLDWRETISDDVEVQDGLSRVCRRLPPMGGHEAVNDFPLLGSVVAVTMDFRRDQESRHKRHKADGGPAKSSTIPELPPLGSWAKLRNIDIILVEGQFKALYLEESKWSPWPDSAGEAADKLYRQRLSENNVAQWAPPGDEELQALWMSPQRQTTKYASLRRVLMEADSGEEQSYKCLVRVIHHQPEDVVDFCRIFPDSDRGPEFCVKLCLQDATAELDAMLLQAQGSKFFMDCPQQNLREHGDNAASLLSLVNRLEGNDDSGRKVSAWTQCCVRRLYPDPTAGKNIMTARYQIENTVMQLI